MRIRPAPARSHPGLPGHEALPEGRCAARVRTGRGRVRPGREGRARVLADVQVPRRGGACVGPLPAALPDGPVEESAVVDPAAPRVDVRAPAGIHTDPSTGHPGREADPALRQVEADGPQPEALANVEPHDETPSSPTRPLAAPGSGTRPPRPCRPGGNHTPFGWTGDGTGIQTGDHPATISREAQQAVIAGGTVSLLEDLRQVRGSTCRREMFNG